MGDYYQLPTCPSPLNHEPDGIRDYIQHYFSCIKICDRARFFDLDNDIWRYEIRRLEQSAELSHYDDDLVKAVAARDAVSNKVLNIATTIEREYQRTDRFRDTIARSSTRDSLMCVCRSHAQWASKTETTRLRSRTGPGETTADDGRAQARRMQGLDPNPDGVFDISESSDGLEHNLHAYLMQFERKDKSNRETHSPSGFVPVDESSSSGIFSGSFPNQRVSIEDLLSPDRTPVLSHGDNDGRIRYLHLPYNNMKWVEQAIARYYHEDSPSYNHMQRTTGFEEQSRAQAILRPELWLGQQLGNSRPSAVSRYLRPLCERVSESTFGVQDEPRNIVCFMPYLHWEVSRTYERISKFMHAESEKYQRQKIEAEYEGTREAILRRKITITRKQTDWGAHEEMEETFVPATSVAEAVFQIPTTKRTAEGRLIRFDVKTGRPLVPHALGQFLLDAARLYELMTTFYDCQVIEKYLLAQPPLHPRRTLDEIQYRNSKLTVSKDRDQVVYRATAVDPSRAHQHVSARQLFASKGKQGSWSAIPQKRPPSVYGRVWPDHTDYDLMFGCQQCRTDSRKIAKILMVDQLWMWILDERTILTCFPRRYGVTGSGDDSSAVHKSIRRRFESGGKPQITSVFDLALIIMDEAASGLFSQISAFDRKPPVLRIYGEAIGNVTGSITTSLDHFFHWIRRASATRRKGVFQNFHLPILAIDREAKLQREIVDIMNEIDMMVSIIRQQREIINRFRDHVQQSFQASQNVDRLDPPRAAAEQPHLLQQLARFQVSAVELLKSLTDRLNELDGLRRNAENTATRINELFALKQQQVGVLQAWDAARQAEESILQGRSLPVFTIVTILFLPLSFLCGVFGMNNANFGGNNWSLGDQFKLIFPISAGIVVSTLVLAYSNFPRAYIWYGMKFLFTWLAVKTGVYEFYVVTRSRWGSERFTEKVEMEIERLKFEVKDTMRKRQVLRREEQEYKGYMNERRAQFPEGWKAFSSSVAVQGSDQPPAVMSAASGHTRRRNIESLEATGGGSSKEEVKEELTPEQAV